MAFGEAYVTAGQHVAVAAAGERVIACLREHGITVTIPDDPRWLLGHSHSAPADYRRLVESYRNLRKRVSRMLQGGTTTAELEAVG